MKIRVGLGYDVHRLAEGESLWLGGILVPHHKGTVAHSDGDVVIHAICDALLGAAGLRDIGYHFPDTQDAYKNIDSKVLLKRVVDLLDEKDFEIGNVDCTIGAQEPKLKSFIPDMVAILSKIMGIEESDLSIKATTTERLGFEGREEGISVQAVVLMCKKQ